MNHDNAALRILQSAVCFFAMDAQDKQRFYEQHRQAGIVLPFVYSETHVRYDHIGADNPNFQLANFAFLLFCVFTEYKVMALDSDNEQVVAATIALNDALNQWIFDDSNTVDDAYIVGNQGCFPIIQCCSLALRALIGTDDQSTATLNFNEIMGIYNHIPTPEAKAILRTL